MDFSVSYRFLCSSAFGLAALVFSPIFVFSSTPNLPHLIEVIDSENADQIGNLFDSSQNVSIEEGRKFVSKFIREFEAKFNVTVDINELKCILFDFLDNEECSLDLKKDLAAIFNKLLIQRNYSFEFASPSYIYYFLSENKTPAEPDKEIPGGVVIGGLETVAGALLWVTPFRKLGIALMADGVRRMLNVAEEMDKEKNKNKNKE